MAKPMHVEARYKGLLKVLTESHQFRFAPSLLFGWMLDEALCRFGLKGSGEKIPEEAKEVVVKALETYVDLVGAQEPFEDILGQVYMALASVWGQKGLGQYFTPQAVSEMMSLMLVGDAYRAMPPGSTPTNGASMWRICDPTCGSGAMTLAFLRIVMRNEGADGLLRFSVTGIDLDGICARMFAVQHLVNCWRHDLTLGELCVYRGNSLGPSSQLQTVVYAIARQHCTSARPPNEPPVANVSITAANGSSSKTHSAELG